MQRIKTKFIRDLVSLCDISFIQLQEHFRKSSNPTSYFKEQFPNFNLFVIPGYRSPGQDNGRPIGGLAQISTKDLIILKSDTENIIDFVEYKNNKKTEKYSFWELLYND